MSVLISEVRPGAYADSIVLMQLQSELARLPGVNEAGVVMGTAVNLELLRSSGLIEAAVAAAADDLVIALRAENRAAGQQALAAVDELMRRGRSAPTDEFRPHTLATALSTVGDGPTWVSISVPGRFASRVAREALHGGAHVFLYSDNVELEEERDLKDLALERGLLVMGPDCGSAIVGGIGFGFTNVVRRGPVGLVCASGTGLQAVTSELHRLGSGVSHALGTGGRDLTGPIGGPTSLQALDLLARDEATRVIAVVSKPPDPRVRSRLLSTAMAIGKPIVLYFIGAPPPGPRIGHLRFTSSLEETATLAAALVSEAIPETAGEASERSSHDRFLRGLFAGGTLAQEALQAVASFLTPVHSNLAAERVEPLVDPARSQHHTILDLGGDEYTVGRLHPMMDQRLRLERLRQEADDPDTGVLLLDIVLGRGAHPDPAAELAPAIDEIRAAGGPRVIAIVVGTDGDVQGLDSTRERLAAAGADVFGHVGPAVGAALARCVPGASAPETPIGLEALAPPEMVINVGLESLYLDLVAQETDTVQLDWRPPAGGNEKMMALLERMRT